MNQYPLPEGWRWAKLGEICEVVAGATPRTDDLSNWDGDILWATPNDMGKLAGFTIRNTERRISEKGLKSCSAKLLPVGSVLLTTRAPIGHVAINLKPMCTNQGFKSLVPSSQVHNWFLFFAIKCFVPALRYIGRGQTFTEISKKQVQDFMIPLPPLFEQRRIAAKIQHLMLDVDRARAACNKQLEAGHTLPAAYLHEVFESEDAKKWERKKLGEVCRINPSKPKNFTRAPNASTTFIPMAAVDERTGTVAKPEVVPYSKVSKGYTYFEENDVLFAKITPCMQNGKHMIARNLIDGIGFGTTEFHVLRPGKEILPEWIWYFVRRACFLREATGYFFGAVGQQRVPENFLANYNISFPPLSLQKYLVAKLNEKGTQLDSIFVAAKNQLDIVNAVPQTILKRAFKGEL